jgi:hypothetical protein
MMLLFAWNEIIKLLIIKLLKMILINEKFNNQVLKAGCCIYMRTDLSENRVSLNFFNDNLIGSHQPKKIYILENQSGSCNIMREPSKTGSCLVSGFGLFSNN